MRVLVDRPSPVHHWVHADKAVDNERAVRHVDPAAPYRLLIADDQWEIREALRLLLKSEGYQTQLVDGPQEVLACLARDPFDLVLLDLNYTRDTTSGREGLDLLSRIRLIDEHLPVVVMTAWSNVDLAVEAMRGGACDFLQKPWDNQHVLGCMRSHVQRYRTLCRQHRDLDREQQDAIATQRRLLPTYLANCPSYEIASVYLPAKSIGGDYFDVLQTETRTVICMADVAGKGVPAALLMANLQATLKPLMHEGTAPAEVCVRLNRHARSGGKLISLFYALLDTASGNLRYANAGHVAPVVIHADGSCRRLLTDGAVLGHFDAWNYREGEAVLQSGDRLLMFTDGLVEAADRSGEEFGEDRLLKLATENRHNTSDELKAIILKSATAHCGGEFQDDATLLVLAMK
jgi:sigma-B regulation protein RsbU (phosphoserine phosphatase)